MVHLGLEQASCSSLLFRSIVPPEEIQRQEGVFSVDLYEGSCSLDVHRHQLHLAG